MNPPDAMAPELVALIRQAVADAMKPQAKAARRLHIAQPAVSRIIQELESNLGVQLLLRTRRSVTLTSAGAVLLHETSLILERVEEATRRVQRTAVGEEGELRLGYLGPPTRPFLGQVLKEFRRNHPRVTVVLEERTPERIWEWVARGRLAVGLTRPVVTPYASGLETLLLRREELRAVLPDEHPWAKIPTIRWRQLAGEPLVVLSRREGVSLHDAVLAACRRARFIPRIEHTPSLITTVLTYVEAGAGIGIVSDSIELLGRGFPLHFRPLLPAHTVELVMVWSDKNDSAPARAFRALVRAKFDEPFP